MPNSFRFPDPFPNLARRPGRRAGAQRVAALGLLVALCAACAPPEPEPVETSETAAVGAALDSVYARFTEAYARANVQILMDEVYHPDAFYLPPESPILQGQEQFRGQFSFLERYARTGAPGPEITFEIVDREISGTLAYDIGMYTIRTPDSPADAEPARGKFIVIWKRDEGGAWRIWADGFSAAPPPTAGP